MIDIDQYPLIIIIISRRSRIIDIKKNYETKDLIQSSINYKLLSIKKS